MASLRCGPWARHIYPSLVLVQPRNTRPCLTERLMMGRKESNQTNKNKICMSFHFKMAGMSCTDDARVKVPSFQNVTVFSTIWDIPQRRHPFVFLFVWRCFWLPWLKSDSLQSDSSFLLRYRMMTNTGQQLNHRFQLFACNLHRKFALFCTL